MGAHREFSVACPVDKSFGDAAACPVDKSFGDAPAALKISLPVMQWLPLDKSGGDAVLANWSIFR